MQLAGVRSTLSRPSDSSPDQGSLAISVELAPFSSADWRPGRAPELVSTVTERLHQVKADRPSMHSCSRNVMDLDILCGILNYIMRKHHQLMAMHDGESFSLPPLIAIVSLSHLLFFVELHVLILILPSQVLLGTSAGTSSSGGVSGAATSSDISPGMAEPGTFSLKQLCLSEGKASWALSLDVYILNADGAVFDTALLAAVSALKGTQVKCGAAVGKLLVHSFSHSLIYTSMPSCLA